MLAFYHDLETLYIAYNMLILYHDHDGRDLDLAYCEKVVDHISYIWNANVKFFTIIEGESWEI